MLFLIFIVGCNNKKDTNSKAVQSDSLALYFAKASDINLSREARIAFNHKALTLLSVQKQDSLYIKNLFKVANQFYNTREIEAYKSTTLLIEQKACQTTDSTTIAQANSYLGDYYKKQSIPEFYNRLSILN